MKVILKLWKQIFIILSGNIDLKKVAYPYGYSNSLDDYQKPIDSLKKGEFFSKLKNKCPSDEKRGRTKEIIKLFDIENGKQLTVLYCKSDFYYLNVCLKKI